MSLASYAQLCVFANAPLASVLKTLSDPIINHIIGNFAKVNKSLHSASGFFFIFMTFFPKSLQNDQNLKFAAVPQSHKMWEWHHVSFHSANFQ